jgi:hypothetical protein
MINSSVWTSVSWEECSALRDRKQQEGEKIAKSEASDFK